jgi:uncharacterized protein (DUF885 family)
MQSQSPTHVRVILTCLGCCFALPSQSTSPDPAPSLHKLFAEYYEFTLRESPERATQVGRTEYNDRWTDYSPTAMARRRKTLLGFRSRSQTIGNVLNEQDQLSRELFDYETQLAIEEIDRLGPYFAVSHTIFGPHRVVFSTMGLAPARHLRDYENLLARLRALPQFVDGLISAGEQAISSKALQPKLVAEQVVQQLGQQISSSAEQSPLLAAFRRLPSSIPAVEQEQLRKAAVEEYERSFQASWRRYRAFVQEKYLPAARDSIGISDASNGTDRYRFLVRKYTTTKLTPEQIHEIGQKEVKRIQTEMAAIRKELAFSGTAEEFAEKILNAPAMRFKSEAEILVHARDIAKRIDAELPRFFLRLPRMPYGVRAIPANQAGLPIPYYERPALDGSRAGNLYVSTANPMTQSKCCLESVVLHEAVPGHHIQSALALELAGIPTFRRVSSYAAYGEGWGLYAETLGKELGLYETPYERYGQLQSEILRAVRLVVDTGIHQMRWSREQSLDLMRVAKGGFITEEFLRIEVDRYIAVPGQALSYKIGALKIQELRARAEKELGGKFNIREFHDVVLRNGPLPLDLLERQIGRYIASNR